MLLKNLNRAHRYFRVSLLGYAVESKAQIVCFQVI